MPEDEDTQRSARAHSLNAVRRETNAARSLFRMKKKPVEERPLSGEHRSQQHWIALLSQILLLLSLLSYVLLGGSFYDDIIHFSSYGVGFTTVEVVALGLSVLLSVVLCIVSGLTYAFARACQWREGRKLGMRGLAVGVMGVFLGVGVLVITFFVERSHL